MRPAEKLSGTSIDLASPAPPDWEGLFQALPDPAMLLGPDFRVIHVNRATQKATGLSERELEGRPCYEIFHDASRPPRSCPLADVLACGRAGTAELQVDILQGRYRVSCAPLLDEQGMLRSVLHVASDVSERTSLAEGLRASEEKFRTVADFTYDWEFWLDSRQRLVYVSPACERVSGYRPEEFIADAALADRIVHPDDHDIWRSHLLRHHGEEAPDSLDEVLFRIVRPDGEARWIEHVCRTVHGAGGRYLGRRATNRDVTRRKRTEDELLSTKARLESTNRELQASLAREIYLAHTDALTGVNNRRRLFERAAHEFEVAARYRRPLSLMMFDIDRFKRVNDAFGHAVGDEVLRRIVQRSCEELRSADVIGRYGGEEFVVILPMTNVRQACPLAERIRTGVAELRVPTPGGEASVTLSIGIVDMADILPAVAMEEAFRRADIALYAAKQGGRNRIVIFSPDLLTAPSRSSTNTPGG